VSFDFTHSDKCRVDLDKGHNRLLSNSYLFTIHNRAHCTMKMPRIRNLGIKFWLDSFTLLLTSPPKMFRCQVDRKRKGTQGGSGRVERDRKLPVQPLHFALVIGWPCCLSCARRCVFCCNSNCKVVMLPSGVLLRVFQCKLRVAVYTGATLLLLQFQN
jgi:hypothetical protein